MKHLRGIEAFVQAVEHGSIAEAARRMGVTPAAASQSIARLEAAIGMPLLTRTTRSLALTDAGRLYHEKVRPLTRELESAHAALDELRGVPQGPLRMACTGPFGRRLVAPLLPSYLAAHPRVQLELVLSDHDIDHMRHGFDLSIRFREQLEPGLVARRIATVPMVFCASPDYLARAGRPRQPEDLKHHDCIVHRMPRTGLVLRWAFLRDGVRFEPEVRATAVCNDIDAIAAMVVAGGGVTRLGSFIANDLIARGLVEPLFLPQGRTPRAQAEPEPLEFYACVLDRRAAPLKVRRLIDHLADGLRDHPGLQPPR
jgi:DNA-binding transcriptional LysR family regulator